jgi:hypothetical protein
MPHESTVNPNEEVKDDQKLIQRPTRTSSVNTQHQKPIHQSKPVESVQTSVQLQDLIVRPITPPTITHHEDFDDDDDSDECEQNESYATF